MDLLIDVNIALDICARRAPHASGSAAASQYCSQNGGKLWVYTGSVQTLQYNLVGEIRRNTAAQGVKTTSRERMLTALALLRAFTTDKHWLAALAGRSRQGDREHPARCQHCHRQRTGPHLQQNGHRHRDRVASRWHQFKAMGADAIHALGKPEHVLYDLKYLLPAADSDLRL
jgi:hypothetical protein